MSGHTNRNRRNGGNPRSRHGSQRQRGGDGRAGQPKNATPPSVEEKAASERKPEPPEPMVENPPPQGAQPPPAQRDARQDTEPPDEPAANAAHQERAERAEPPEGQEGSGPRSRLPFASAMRGGHAYIPATPPNGARPGQNGQSGHSGQNGHSGSNGRQGVNGRLPAERQSWVDDDGEGEGGSDVPGTWRVERLNGGTDTTPHEPARPESRGEVGPLIDTLHELFAQDRAMASRGDSARCGICYLHFPLIALEHRENEGFYVCEGCKRLLGHQRLMMVRRQQAPGG